MVDEREEAQLGLYEGVSVVGLRPWAPSRAQDHWLGRGLEELVRGPPERI